MRAPAMILFAATVLGLSATATTMAHGDPLRAGRAAYARADYTAAARLMRPLAERGNAHAQALLGFMYANGQGVPQAYDAAAYWYRLSAEQGNSLAQYLLGLMYDKGHGVPMDGIAAYKWLNLAAAAAPRRDREYYLRLRDAVASKMTRDEVELGQQLALEWTERRRHR
jgi:TPR repeat protein